MGILFFITVITLFSIANAFDNGSDSSTDLLCPITHFGCKNAYKCIENEHLCNGKNNCGDSSDEDVTTCILKGKATAQLNCTVNEFQCKNDFRCVPYRFLCDGDNDCKDNSDEDPHECISSGIYDDHVKCADIGFICGEGTGPCISRKLLCNGNNDCGDNTDENITNCRAEGTVQGELRCNDDEFGCKNEFKCVPKSFLCDHDNDCFDGSDEDPLECAKEGFVPEGTTCADLGFECRNTTFGGSFCIGNLFICDGNNNCGDNSDENPEICEHRSDKPTLEILPWYEPPEPNSTVVRLCGNDEFICGQKCFSKKYLCHPDNDCTGGNSSVCLNRTGSHKCMSHQFKCKNNKCVSKEHVCDGDDDCGDMSDEDPMRCGSTVRTTITTARRISLATPPRKLPLICKRDQFKCLDGSRCIRITTVCDRQRHCADGSDETADACTKMIVNFTIAAPCGQDEFQCNNKRCIEASFVCDGDNDCQDYTDESPPYCNLSSTRAMSTASCWDWQFRCAALSSTPTECIPYSQVCDGTRNCPFGDDESVDLCPQSSPTISTTTRRTNGFKPLVINVTSNRRTFIIGDLDDNLTLVCPLVGVPEPEYRWTFDSKNTKLVHEVNSRKLTFRHTHEKLAGKYVCEARNVHGVNTFEFQVSIQQQHISAKLSSTTITWVVLGSILLVIVLCAAVMFPLKYFRVKRQLKNLTPQEAQEFLDGIPMSEVVSHQSGSEMAMYLPFEKRIEPNSLTLARNLILGKGEYGIVCHGSLNAEAVAVKTFKRSVTLDEFRACLVEVKLMSFVGEHPNIIRFIGADVTNIQSREILVVMELSPIGSLEKHLRMLKPSIQTNYVNTTTTKFSSGYDELTIEKLCGFCEQIAFAMEYMESRNVIHGDLAARNVLVFNHGVVKVTDFGYSRQLYEKNLYKPTKNRALPWRWASIELLRQMEFSTESDIWAFGVTVWEIFTFGDIPYALEKLNEAFVHSLMNGLRLSKPERLSESQYSFVKGCWDLNKSARPKFSALKSFFATEKETFRLDIDAPAV